MSFTSLEKLKIGSHDASGGEAARAGSTGPPGQIRDQIWWRFHMQGCFTCLQLCSSRCSPWIASTSHAPTVRAENFAWPRRALSSIRRVDHL